jgi:hypothetical protein
VLGDDAGQRHGEVEAEAELFLLRVGDPEDRPLGLGAGAAGEDVEVLDGGGGERHEAVVLVDAANRVDHLLAGQHLVGKEVAETAGEPRLDHFGHGDRVLYRPRD